MNLSVLLLLCLPVLSEEKTIVYVGEDGTPVYGDSVASPNHAQVDSELFQEALTRNSLDVIVFLSNQPSDRIAQEVRHDYRNQLRTQSDSLRKLYRDDSSSPENVKTAQENMDRTLGEMKQKMYQRIATEILSSQREVEEKILALGGKITARFKTMNALSVELPSQALTLLAEMPEVAWVEKNRASTTDLNVSAQAVFAPAFWNAGITGSTFDVSLVDGPVETTHPSLSSHTIIVQPGSPLPSEMPYPLNFHGTFVAGVMASTHPTYKGIAYGCDKIYSGYGGLISGGQGDEGAAFTAFDWILSQEDAAEVINLSKSYGVATQDDNGITRFCDAIVSNFDVMISKSAGNNGCGVTVGYPGPAWNILVVGATDDKNTVTRSDDKIAGFSSTGPTAAGRKKPDLCAPGANITSLGANGTTITASGTSFSAPHVSAAVVLLYQAGHYSALSVKATLINTADSWSDGDTCNVFNDAQVSGVHWDKNYGWGYLNLANAQAHATDFFMSNLTPKGQHGEYKLFKGPMQNGDKATMTWNRRVGYNGPDYPNTWYLLSDLNLALYNEGDNFLLAQDLDPDDNVHQVGTTASYNTVIRCYAWSTYFDGGVGEEEFALATPSGFQEAQGPKFLLHLRVPEASVFDNEKEILVTANIRNTGDLTAHSNVAKLNLPHGFTLISGANPQELGSIAAGTSKSVQWKIKTPNAPGNYIITVTNDSSSYGAEFTGFGSAVVKVGN